MRRFGLFVMLILGWTLWLGGKASGGETAPPLLELRQGMNEISLSVVNGGQIDLRSVEVEVDRKSLPGWVKLCESDRKVDVPMQGERSLIVRMEVLPEAPSESSFELSLTLKDRAGQTWGFKALAQVIEVPSQFELFQNTPNPFNPATTIRYAVASETAVRTRLVLFNSLGQAVRTLVDAAQKAGFYSVVWDGRDDSGREVASGIYLCRLVCGDFVKLRKVLLLR